MSSSQTLSLALEQLLARTGATIDDASILHAAANGADVGQLEAARARVQAALDGISPERLREDRLRLHESLSRCRGQFQPPVRVHPALIAEAPLVTALRVRRDADIAQRRASLGAGSCDCAALRAEDYVFTGSPHAAPPRSLTPLDACAVCGAAWESWDNDDDVARYRCWRVR